MAKCVIIITINWIFQSLFSMKAGDWRQNWQKDWRVYQDREVGEVGKGISWSICTRAVMALICISIIQVIMS